MGIIPAISSLTFHEPGINDLCVCGSGIKFKKCCKNTYSSEAPKLFSNAYDNGNYKNALIHARSYFTWYALSHKARTIPLKNAHHAISEHMLYIDIEALSDLLENLHLCYYHLKRIDEFLDVIERARNVVQDKRWEIKIALARGIWYLADQHNADAAFASIKMIDIQSCYDSDFLTLYLDVNPIRLSLTETVDIIDRIIANTKKESVKLQYRVLKALKFYLACQQENFSNMIEEAISDFSSLPENKKSLHGKVKLVNTLGIYGKITHKSDVLEQGREEVKKLIQDVKHGSIKLVADLYKLLGDFEEDLMNHHEAIEAYSESLKLMPSELTKVFLAKSICASGDFNKATELLKAIDDTMLDELGNFDLAITWGLIAANSRIYASIEEAKRRLKDVKAHEPLFMQLRDQLIIDLFETNPKIKSGPIRKAIRTLNKYISLNPSFFGVGIDFNKMIDDTENLNKKNKK